MKNLIAIALLSVLVLFSCVPEEEKSVRDDRVSVETGEIVWQKVTQPIHTSGTAAPVSESKLSFKTGGIIKKLYADEGEKVKRGKLLAELDLAEIESQVEKAAEGFRKAERDLARVENLYKDSVATLEQFQNATTAYQVAEKDLKIARFNLKFSRIYAPADGKILYKFTEENELIGSGMPVFLFASLEGRWKIKAGVSDKDLVKLEEGFAANVVFDAWPENSYPAVISETGSFASPVNGTYEIELELKDHPAKLAPGFVARVDIQAPDDGKYAVVPVESLVEAEGDHASIFVRKEKSEEIMKVAVRIEKLIKSFAAVSGVDEEYHEVITSGSEYLSPESKIRIAENL